MPTAIQTRLWLAAPLILSLNQSLLQASEPSTILDALLECSRQVEPANAATRRGLAEAKVQCSPWHVIGPFKDAEYGVFAREFETAFAPEKDVVARSNQPAELDKVYQSHPVIGAPDSSRGWVAHPEWTDGYFNALPSGPPPGRNEVTYLYRTITCAAPVEAPVWLVTLDAAKAWLDGKQILDAPIRGGAGQRFLQVSFKVPLHAGENRLLLKIAKCFQTNGFSFAIDGLHPIHPVLKGQPLTHDEGGFDLTYEPYASALRQQTSEAQHTFLDPHWYVKRDTWRETLLASRQAAAVVAKPRGDLPYKSQVLRQKDGPQHVRLNVSGRKWLVLVCTIGGDNYDYDDTIWAEPKLVARDGTETRLVDLQPTEAQVGFDRLHVLKDGVGRTLQIGQRQFTHGYWAHAPSRLVYLLDGRYEWIDTWFGLDAAAVVSGTAEFIIADSIDSAALTESPRYVDLRLIPLLTRDFPGKDQRHEIQREAADGIWETITSAGQNELLCQRYAAAIFHTMRLSPDEAGRVLQRNKMEGLAALRSLYHQTKQLDESLKRLRQFRFDVKPLPTYDPPVLAMQQAMEKVAPTPGGVAYLARLEPVREKARAALAAHQAGRPGAAKAILAAAESLERFQEESVRAIGPILFVRHRTFGRINAVDPYDLDVRGPASIALFDPAKPELPPRAVYHDPDGAVWQASLSYDAKTVFFAARRQNVPGAWHIFEIGIDGRNLRQITNGPQSDIAPVELPDGQILFVSNRAGNQNVCQANRAGALYVCRRDGTNVHRVSANTLSDHTPAVMDDGRVMFTRWDYGVDKGVFQRHGVWTMNPDGSHLQLFFGNVKLDPNAFWQCVPVPGRPEVISTFGGHHAGPYGVAGLLWNHLGIEAPRGTGFRFLTPEYPSYFDGAFWNGYMDPHPLNENEFLVSYGGDGGQKSRLFLLDSRGNKTCLWEEAGDLGCYNPLALHARLRPPVIPISSTPRNFEYVDPVVAGICPNDTNHGTFLLSDVTNGLQGHVRRGEIKALQIMELVPKTRPHTGGYAWNVSPTIGRGTFYVRRLIGIVPVEEDGSAHFTAPAVRDISFNALDAEGRVVQKMGSTTQTMPGEVQSCYGCHVYDRAPSVKFNRLSLAARRPPCTPVRPDWGTNGILDYCLVVQPVWDRHCVRCHSGPRPAGNLDLSSDKTRYFNMSYDMLIDRGFIHHVPQNGADQDHTTPRANGSLASRLVTGKYLESGHFGVALSQDDLQRVYTWIDANVPYYHTYLYTDGGVNGARDRWYAKPGWASNDGLADAWFQKQFAPVFLRRCHDCHRHTVEISDAWLGRNLVTVTSKVWSDITLMDQGLQIEGAVATFGPEYRINLTHPEWSQMLTAPLAREAGGLGCCKGPDGKAIFKGINDPDYRRMLGALQKGKQMLELNPRVDMLPRPDPAHPEAYAPGLQRRRVMP